MINTATSSSWAAENARWRSSYADTLPKQIDRLIIHIEKNKSKKETLSHHFESMIRVFEQGLAHPNLATHLKLVNLVRALHPLPIWWGKWTEWMHVLSKTIVIAQEANQIDVQIWLELKQAEMLLSTGKGEEALVVAQKTLKTSRTHQKFKIEFQAEMLLLETQRYLGHIQNPLNDLEKLEKSLSEKKKHLSSSVAQKLEIEFSLKKSDVLQRHGHIEKALEQSQRAYQLSETLFDRKDLRMAQVHSRLGANYWAKSEYEKSIAHYVQAREIFQLWGDQTSQIDSMGDIGLVYWRSAQYKKAEEILEKSIRMAEEVNARQWQTIQTGDLGVVSLSRGKLSRAAALMEQHLELSVLTKNHTELERANSNFANAQLHLGKFDEAYPRLRRSLKSVEEKRLEIAIGVVRAKLAWALEGLGFQEDAIKYAKSALTHANKINKPPLLIVTLRAISETIDITEDRIRYAEEALQLARKHARPLNEAGALFTLANCYQDDALVEEATEILERIGAKDWLKAPVVFRTLRIPLLL